MEEGYHEDERENEGKFGVHARKVQSEIETSGGVSRRESL